MKNLLLIFICILFTTGISAQKRTDAFEKMNSKEKEMIKPFSGNHIAGIANAANNKVIIETINAEQVKQLAKSSANTMISICSSTCAYCKVRVPHFLNLSLKFPDMKIILVELDYKPKQIEKLVLESDYRGTVYILDREMHGNLYHQKHANFTEKVCTECVDFTNTPHNILLDTNGNLVKHLKAYSLTADTLTKYIQIAD